MRTAICIALVTMAITMFGCEWFTSKKKASTGFNIEGKWIVDSLKDGGDSSGAVSWLWLVDTIINDMNDTAGVTYNFNKDSVVAQLSHAVSIANYYAFDSSQKQLTVKADSTEKKYAFTAINDSVFSLTDVDNSVIRLKRQ